VLLLAAAAPADPTPAEESVNLAWAPPQSA
jgi:hypothetical protein